jgi:hypothetical protein
LENRGSGYGTLDNDLLGIREIITTRDNFSAIIAVFILLGF